MESKREFSFSVKISKPMKLRLQADKKVFEKEFKDDTWDNYFKKVFSGEWIPGKSEGKE
jgi:hypothetical protein